MNSKILFTTAALTLAATLPLHAVTISQWTFETSQPTTSGPFGPESGFGSAMASHADSSAAFSNPVGNGSAESWSATRWAFGDYWQFQVSTIGFKDISISWDQAGSGTGPRDFALQFSTDGSLFTQVGAEYQIAAQNWSSSTFHNGFTFAPDLSAISLLIADQTNVFFRLVENSTTNIDGTGAVTAAGTSRIDNFTVTGDAITTRAIPDSLSFTFTACFLLGFFAFAHKVVGVPQPAPTKVR